MLLQQGQHVLFTCTCTDGGLGCSTSVDIRGICCNCSTRQHNLHLPAQQDAWAHLEASTWQLPLQLLSCYHPAPAALPQSAGQQLRLPPQPLRRWQQQAGCWVGCCQFLRSVAGVAGSSKASRQIQVMCGM